MSIDVNALLHAMRWAAHSDGNHSGSKTPRLYAGPKTAAKVAREYARLVPAEDEDDPTDARLAGVKVRDRLIAQHKFVLHGFAQTTEEARRINTEVDRFAAEYARLAPTEDEGILPLGHEWVSSTGRPWSLRVKSDNCAYTIGLRGAKPCGRTPDVHDRVPATPVPAEDEARAVVAPDLGDSPSYFVKATVPAEDGPTEPCPTCMQPVYVPQRGDHDYGLPLVPAKDEGRLREALAAVELYPTQWQEGLPVDIDTYRRGILAILRAALAATPEPRT